MTTPKVYFLTSSRGEVRVETGVGRVTHLKPSGAESPYIELTIKAPPLVNPVTGWADRRVPPFCDLFAGGLGAFAAGSVDVDFAYRVEVHRQLGVNPSMAIEDVDTRLKRRRLVALTPYVAPKNVIEAVVAARDETDPIGDALRTAFAHLPGPVSPTGVGMPRAATPDWVPFEALIDLTRHLLNARDAALGDASTAGKDQTGAVVRDWLIDAGVDVTDEHALHAVFAGIALTEYCGMRVRGGQNTSFAAREALCALVLNMPAGSKAAAA